MAAARVQLIVQQLLLAALLARAAPAPSGGNSSAASGPAARPAGTLGAMCECRCCWDIGAGRQECRSKSHEFLLDPKLCASRCTDAECSARFANTCRPGNGVLQATCHRSAPRTAALLFFVIGAAGLLVVAIVRRPPPAAPEDGLTAGTSQELNQRELDLLAKRDYGSTELAVKAEEMPFLLTPPETDVVVGNLAPISE